MTDSRRDRPLDADRLVPAVGTHLPTRMYKRMIMAMARTDTSLEVVFAALADRTRLRLLNLMSRGEVCVCFFVEVLDEPQPKISRHLAYLRHAGLVQARRDGKWIHYGIAEDLPKAVR